MTFTYKLISQEQYSFEREFPVTKVEEIFQTGPQKLHHHDCVIALHAVILHLRDANYANLSIKISIDDKKLIPISTILNFLY